MFYYIFANNNDMSLALPITMLVISLASDYVGHHTVSTSEAVTIDVTPPEVRKNRLQTDPYLQTKSSVKLSWLGVFHDPESGI